jgi:hypothetical protein
MSDYSKKTQMTRTRKGKLYFSPGYKKLADILTKNCSYVHKILDYGSGKCEEAEHYNSRKIATVHTYEPYPSGFQPHYKTYTKIPHDYYSIVLCNYVLNVVEQDDRLKILDNIRQVTKMTGRVIVCTRSQLNPKDSWTSHKDGFILPTGQFQATVTERKMKRLATLTGFEIVEVEHHGEQTLFVLKKVMGV